MKINRTTIYHVKGEGLKPVVILDTDEGIVGLAEAATFYGTGGSGTAAMIAELCMRFVIRANPLNINALMAEMYAQSFWLKTPGEVAGASLSALELALWDLRARSLAVPVYDLFGGKMRETVCAETELMLDLAGRLSTGDTIAFCRAIEAFNISIVEEAYGPEDLGALRQISDRIGIQIAPGERDGNETSRLGADRIGLLSL